MSEAFLKLANKVADERELQTKDRHVAALMDNMNMTLEQAMNVLEIQGKDRAIIAKQLQKQ
ncbi:hypothetical protein [Butyrivibrio fibrisolvens]|uniref:hypothetical protein n=1 Tax=Butyrivibrio fibrisolvens TaxID=831 RepID=UPI000415ADB5|nr:hypothetical protein [Butyrivibrio fibrisolvens]